jgi:hypothetical protein
VADDRFARDEQRLMPFLIRKQRGTARLAASFAPKSSAGIVLRDQVSRLRRVRSLADFAIGRALRDDSVLPQYDMPSR